MEVVVELRNFYEDRPPYAIYVQAVNLSITALQSVDPFLLRLSRLITTFESERDREWGSELPVAANVIQVLSCCANLHRLEIEYVETGTPKVGVLAFFVTTHIPRRRPRITMRTAENRWTDKLLSQNITQQRDRWLNMIPHQVYEFNSLAKTSNHIINGLW